MPATPVFTLTQDATTVLVRIRVPYVRIGAMETHVDGCDFSFYCKPYLLRLRLPHACVDDEARPAKAVYDPIAHHGTVTVHLPKEEPGIHFEGLDMLTRLLSKPPAELSLSMGNGTGVSAGGGESKRASGPGCDPGTSNSRGTLIEEVPREGDDKVNAGAVSVTCTANRESDPASVLLNNVKYGFGNQYSGMFHAIRDEIFDLVELPDPDRTPADERYVLRVAHEDAAFDWQRYGSDGCAIEDADDPLVVEALAMSPHWRVQSRAKVTTKDASYPELSSLGPSLAASSPPLHHSVDGFDGFTERELETMRQLPRRAYAMQSVTARRQLLSGLCDILFGYAYDYRMTSGGEATAESNWTISILSPTLSWLDPPETPRDAVIASVRRALCYPYLRCWTFCDLLLEDVEMILRLGQRCVLRALLAIREIFAKSESKYLLNRLWIDDYCVWLQTPEVGCCLKSLAEEYAEARAKLGKGNFPKWKLSMIEKCFADMRIVAAAEATTGREQSDASSSAATSEEDDDDDDVEENVDRGCAEGCDNLEEKNAELMGQPSRVSVGAAAAAAPVSDTGINQQQTLKKKRVLIEEL